MRRKLLLLMGIVLCLCLSACSERRANSIESHSVSNEDTSVSQSQFQSESSVEILNPSEDKTPLTAENGDNHSDGFLPEKEEEIDDELIDALQKKVGKIAPTYIFCYDFDISSCPEDGYYFYLAGCCILGDTFETTLQYATQHTVDRTLEDYPYTPASIMDMALQEYFAIPTEQLHTMIENYDEEIDGYWAPMGVGGSSAKTDIISCEVSQNTAILSCESRSVASSDDDPSIFAAVTMEYSEEYGWRFLSCSVL